MVDVELFNGLNKLVRAGEAVDEVRQILSENKDLINYDKGLGTSLMYAVSKNHFEMSKMLIEMGSDVNHLTPDEDLPTGDTPIDSAIDSGYPKMLELLLDSGAKPVEEHRLVLKAVSRRHDSGTALQLIQLLDKAGCDLHKIFEHKGTGAKMNVYSQAESNDHPDVVEYLKQRGCQPPEVSA